MAPTWNGRTHPAARVFPLLTGEEFDALVADIERNGLLSPGVLLPDGTLLDGRNRQRACKKAGVPMPAGVNMTLPAPTPPSLSWNQNRMRIGYPNFPTQEAINFVGYLINAQSGRAKFSRGVGTVGGFHHVGVVTRRGYEAIKEPELKHPFTGFEP